MLNNYGIWGGGAEYWVTPICLSIGQVSYNTLKGYLCEVVKYQLL